MGGIAIAGCHGLKDKVVGTWRIDPSSAKSSFLDQLKKRPDAEKVVEESLAAARFKFAADGTFEASSTQGGGPQAGKWTLNGRAIDLEIPGRESNKPEMTLNEDGSRIHYSESGSLGVEMDLVKTGD